MANNSDNTNLITFIAGLAVGALVGVLLAPDSGERTRGKIAKKSNELLEDLEGQLEIAKHKVNQFSDVVREKAGAVADNVKSRAGSLRNRVNSTVTEEQEAS
jgi:gas vesicle protein